MKIEKCPAYELVEEKEISELHSVSCILRHKKTGARVALLSNDDDNKVFYIGFRTPPEDSTGVAHILEHSVLCGSEAFPVKDPFIELAKGSLNTFLNAMTYPDKTVYPVASCNDADFQNLIHVYLDAVFHPNIYKQENIFRQEGWHYQLDRKDVELKVNGVVYNEMKGAFSSPDDVMDREVFNSLFPDSAYGFESGGDPAVIPRLTYEDFLKFHGRYYHPSNSYIYLYGDMDMEEKLNWIDENYLSQYDALEIDSHIGEQKPFPKTVHLQKEYPIIDSEPLEENTYLSYNTVVADSLDRNLYQAFQVLDDVLCMAPGAPVKEALQKKGIGKDIYSMYENGIRQPYFSIVAKNADPQQKDAFVQTVEDTLKHLVKTGIKKDSIRASLNHAEFKYREADFGSYPKGLMYGLQILDSWLYDDRAPFIHVEAGDTFRYLKEQIDTDYYENLIQKYLLNNTHKSVLVVAPKRGLQAAREQEQKERMAALKASMSDGELERLVRETKALEEYQGSEDSPEDMGKIPMLKRSDLKREIRPFQNRAEMVEGIETLYHDIFTNGIAYVRLVFGLDQIPRDMYPYLSLFKAVFGLLNTDRYTYGEFSDQVNIHTGGMSASINNYIYAEDSDQYSTRFEIRASVLKDKVPKAFELIREMMFHSHFEDVDRIRDILGETRSRAQASFMSAGHSVAMFRAISYFSPTGALVEEQSGLDAYHLLDDICNRYEEKKADLSDKLKILARMIFRRENLMVDFTSPKEDGEDLPGAIRGLKTELYTEEVRKETFVPQMSKKNEGFTSSSQVQFVCRAGNYREKGFRYTGALRVLKVIMGYDYLWNNVRVKGGAYGCMCGFGKSGDSYFVSYRDPNLKETVDIFEDVADYVKNFDVDERSMTKYVIGAVSAADTPLTPASSGARSMTAYLTGVDPKNLQKERDEMLDATAEDIRSLAGHMEAILSDDCLCVVGSEQKIKENEEMFRKVTSLLGSEA